MTDITRDPSQDTEDGMLAYVVTSPIRLDQFDAELSDEVGLTADGPLDTASTETPATIWVDPGVDSETVLSVGEAHTPDESWSDESTVTEPTVADVQARAAAGEVLSADEIQVALRHLLEGG